MRLFIVILLLNALVVMPLSGIGLSDRDCCPINENAYAIDVNETQRVDKCCSPATDQSEDTEDDQPRSPEPCDDADCPITCCATTAPAAYVLPITKVQGQSFRSKALVLACIEFDLDQPHLLRLKRPPRAV